MQLYFLVLVDDEPIPEVEMARAAEQHARTAEFGRLCNEGHVRVINDDDPCSVRCKVQNEVFTESRELFPSVQLMARLQLAIAAGQSCRNVPSDEYRHDMDAYRYMFHTKIDHVWLDEPYDVFERWAHDEAVAQGYSNVAKKTKLKVTATVKGLRP